jgi:hypothetical protein
LKLNVKGKRFYVKGVAYDVDVSVFRGGDGEAGGVFGFAQQDGRTIEVDASHQDDSTLMHELGHAICYEGGIYMSEDKMLAWEDLFASLRDPRNFWVLEYLAGSKLTKGKEFE